MSLSQDPVFSNGDDVGLGQQFLSLGDGLEPGEEHEFSFWVGPMPWAPPIEHTLHALVDVPPTPGGSGVVCEQSELNNATGAPVFTTVADAYIALVSSPSDVIGNWPGQPSVPTVNGVPIGPRHYTVLVGRNDVGIDVMNVPIRVTVGTPGHPDTTWGDAVVAVQRGQEVLVDVAVPTPISYGGPGQSNTFPVMACVDSGFDPNWLNNCADGSVSIAVPWWDVQLGVSAPSSASVCGSVTWTVLAKNVGNVDSFPVCGSSVMCPLLGPCSPSFPFGFGTLYPGHSAGSEVQLNLFNAILGPQKITAAIPAGACQGADFPSGNFASHDITITSCF